MTQLTALLLWLGLLLVARAEPESVLPSDLFLVTDPLVAALAMGASHLWVPVAAFSLVLVVATLVLGRVFCGWLCPLGTLLDLCARLFGPPEARFAVEQHRAMQRWKYYLLVLFAAGALASAQWVYLLDPLVLLARAVVAGVWPALSWLLPTALLGDELDMTSTRVAFAPVALLVVVLGLTALSPRFYCRYLCPLGAFYGLLSRVPLLRRRVRGCDGCTALSVSAECIRGCRMGAVPEGHPTRGQSHECIRCFSGRSFCHRLAIHFDWLAPRRERKDEALNLDRRAVVVVGLSGIGLAPLVSLSAYHRGDPNRVVRPPRVLDEETFVDQCIRCNMCVAACPTQTLQPTHLEAGVAGFWTPALTPSVGGCVADCNACSLACPTAAIPAFSRGEADRWGVKMGTAVLEKDRCISYGEGLPCAKCIDICPTKAFVVEAARPGSPRRPLAIDYARCVGCGLCELACARIVFGTPALLTFAHGRGEPTSLAQQPTATYAAPVR